MVNPDTKERLVTHSVSGIEPDERSTIETFFDGCSSIFESQQDFELPDAVNRCLPIPAKQQQLSGKKWAFGGCYPHFVFKELRIKNRDLRKKKLWIV